MIRCNNTHPKLGKCRRIRAHFIPSRARGKTIPRKTHRNRRGMWQRF